MVHLVVEEVEDLLVVVETYLMLVEVEGMEAVEEKMVVAENILLLSFLQLTVLVSELI